MDERKNTNPLIPVCVVLVVLLFAMTAVSAKLWFGKTEAEKSAQDYKTSYEKLLEEKEEAEQAEQDEKQQIAQYETDMREVVNLMLDGAVATENCANLMQSVWHNCIFQISDSETDKYTMTASGTFYDDFNDALYNLYMDEKYTKDNKSIIDNQAAVTEKIRKLKNPPEEWKDAYSDLLLYYDSYYDFTELVLNTNCSLNEFKGLFQEYDAEALKRYQKMKLYLE